MLLLANNNFILFTQKPEKKLHFLCRINKDLHTTNIFYIKKLKFLFLYILHELKLKRDFQHFFTFCYFQQIIIRALKFS